MSHPVRRSWRLGLLLPIDVGCAPPLWSPQANEANETVDTLREKYGDLEIIALVTASVQARSGDVEAAQRTLVVSHLRFIPPPPCRLGWYYHDAQVERSQYTPSNRSILGAMSPRTCCALRCSHRWLWSLVALPTPWRRCGPVPPSRTSRPWWPPSPPCSTRRVTQRRRWVCLKRPRRTGMRWRRVQRARPGHARSLFVPPSFAWALSS